MSERQPEKVLVIDDDEHCRRSLERGLQRLGYEVSLAVDGEEGYRQAMAGRPQVILTDLRMPQMDGHTLLRRLLAQRVDAAVIVMSAHGSMDDVVDALRNGAVDYLKKPWTQGELVAAVARALEINEQRRASKGAEPRSALESLPETPGPAGAGAPSAVEGRDPIFSRILTELRRGQITLPAVPAVVGQLRAMFMDQNAEVDKLAALIERDQQLTTQVLRIANSAAYARSGRASDLRGAIGRIGFRQVQAVVETAFAHRCWQPRRPELRQIQQRLSRHSVVRALSMRAIAAFAPAGIVDPQVAYVVGLLCDVGASFLVWLQGERAAPGPSEAVSVELLDLIAQAHQEVGVAVLSKWQLDPVVAFVAGNHHAVEAPKPPNPYWSLSHLGLALAESLGLANDITLRAPPSTELVEMCASALRVDLASIDRLRDGLRDEAASLLEALG